ncbi:MAG: MOSC domain-containing protein [Gemmatimonadota bacterium]
MSDERAHRIEAIWRKTGRRGPMEAVDEATLVEGVGIEGNADRGGYRQVTLLDADAWERATVELGVAVDPAARRANVLIRGLDLRESSDRVVRIGGARIQVRGETRPCQRMDDASDGLREALVPDWRGGAYGTVLGGGTIRVGDEASWE